MKPAEREAVMEAACEICRHPLECGSQTELNARCDVCPVEYQLLKLESLPEDCFRDMA